MAVVFISPKQRQKTFFVIITCVFLLFLLIFSFGVFFAGPTQVSPVLVFNKPKVNIDMAVFDTDQFKNLEAFTQMETQYAYTATDQNDQTQSGFVSAISMDAARTILTSSGLNVSSLAEVAIGRDNPFTPYYESVVAPITPTTTKTPAKTTTTKK